MATDLIKVEEVSKLFTSFPDVVGKNDKSVANCNVAGRAILDTIEAEGMTEELDAKASEYLSKVNTTIKNMNQRRTPFTQIFDKVRSYFTSQEKAIDPKNAATIPGMITAKRNEYANWKYQEEQKRKKEAEQRAALEREKATYREAIENEILSLFNKYLASKISEVQSIFNNLSYANFDREAIAITVFSADYPKAYFDRCANSCQAATYYISSVTKEEIKRNILVGKYELYAAEFKTEISRVRQELIDRIPSKRMELHETEELRKTNAEAAMRAEQERKQREAEDTQRRLAELKRKEDEEKQKVSVEAQQASMNSLFDQTAAAMPTTPTNARVKEKIQVLNQQGFLPIFQMWWLGEGQNMSIEDLEKIFKKMITYCEKQANSKDQTHIESQFVKYVDDVKAK